MKWQFKCRTSTFHGVTFRQLCFFIRTGSEQLFHHCLQSLNRSAVTLLVLKSQTFILFFTLSFSWQRCLHTHLFKHDCLIPLRFTEHMNNLFPLRCCWNIHVSRRKSWRCEGKCRSGSWSCFAPASLQQLQFIPLMWSNLFIVKTLALMITLDSQNKPWFPSKANQSETTRRILL